MVTQVEVAHRVGVGMRSVVRLLLLWEGRVGDVGRRVAHHPSHVGGTARVHHQVLTFGAQQLVAWESSVTLASVLHI